MIFISYNHKDESLVDMIVRRLELELGRKNIFYDKWSIQPGDSIIGKMDEGLEQFSTFFYFLSPNSLSSKMVALEWKNALYKAVNEKLKFVAVRIADCSPPSILKDSLYIDLYGEGIEDAVAKMKCVVKGKNTYSPLEDIENMVAIVQNISSREIKIEIRAQFFSENNPNVAFLCENELKDFEVVSQESICNISAGNARQNINGEMTILHGKAIQLYRPITPRNSLRVTIKSKGCEVLKLVQIMQMLSNTEGKQIKLMKGVVD